MNEKPEINPTCVMCQHRQYTGKDMMICRRYPPVTPDGKFPVVRKWDYCSEFMLTEGKDE